VTDRPADTRRGFLKAATLALGGTIGAVLAIPLVRYFLHPVGRRVVSSGDGPIDVAAESSLVAGGPPVKVPVVATSVRDGWATGADVVVGSAYLSKDADGKVTAFSAVCPHLGCAVAFRPGDGTFRCPCHKSVFGRDGHKQSGPSKRGLDPLPVTVEDGRVKLTYIRFKSDVPDREKA
jgi:menaquinol-cytochrome c reductase iron-sulfur subunit